MKAEILKMLRETDGYVSGQELCNQDVYKRQAKAAKLAKRVITHEKEVLGCDGYNVLQNNGEVAGQTVFHFHMHLIPRYDGEKTIIDWDHKEFSDDEMKAICNEMKL